ncbi:toll-like receptor 2 type-2 [Anabrus simplex]|uniref:toll-like receptor 2 type-2 n=1 Tax=Anabrus simplex TaxID=316456 RepID=UPI0035A31158
MLHLYKIRQRARAFALSAFNKYAFDAFVCYSSIDRRFVLTRLAPLLEKGREKYCICLHERDFPLGSHIVSNIVGSIQHSRKTIIVLSEHFINSKWCNWELEIANYKVFNEDEHFLILIQLETMDRNKLPRHLQFLMDTRTYLEWPSPGQNDEEELVVQRLKSALGPSIFQTTNEMPPLLSEVMEDY